MVDVQKDSTRLEEAGGRIAFVTMGTPREAGRFRETTGTELILLSDARQEAYAAYGLSRGSVWQVMGPKVWPSLIRGTVRAGAGKPVGDIWQMPGTFVIDRQGVVRFTHIPADQSQRPNNEELIAVLQSLADS